MEEEEEEEEEEEPEKDADNETRSVEGGYLYLCIHSLLLERGTERKIKHMRWRQSLTCNCDCMARRFCGRAEASCDLRRRRNRRRTGVRG